MDHGMKKIFALPTVWPLLIVNLVTIVFAVVEHWSLPTILWTYWVQSVLIGLFQCLKMLHLKKFSTDGFTMNGRSVLPTEETKRRTAGFFLLHYGLFHFVYAIFLASTNGSVDVFAVAVAGIAFAANHVISYRSNKALDEARVRNIGSLMFFPYLRIIPMHLAAMLLIPFAGSVFSLMMFLSFRTAADVIMHYVEHRRGEAPV